MSVKLVDSLAPSFSIKTIGEILDEAQENPEKYAAFIAESNQKSLFASGKQLYLVVIPGNATPYVLALRENIETKNINVVAYTNTEFSMKFYKWVDIKISIIGGTNT